MKPNCFAWDSMSFMPILPSRMAVEECPWWSEMCLTAKSSSRRVCWLHGLCPQHWCHPRSSHQRWKPPWAKNLDWNLVGSRKAGKTAGEIELGQVGTLVPRECGGSKRASPGLSCVHTGEQ